MKRSFKKVTKWLSKGMDRPEGRLVDDLSVNILANLIAGMLLDLLIR